jgi:hypothetical protein
MAVLLFAMNAIAQAQENPPPAPAPAPAEAAKTEMQKWIEATDTQWQAAFKRDVTDVREAEVRKLMLQYLNMLEDAIGKASKAGDLKGALALRDEQKRFGDTQLLPEKDDAADTAAAVKEIRTAIRAHLAKLETDTAVRAKALHAKYDQMLAQAQTQLTQRQRLDDALLVQKKRDEVAGAWLAGTPATPAPAVVEQPKPKTPAVAVSTATPAPKATAGNLVVNGTFEKGMEGWTLHSHHNSGTMAFDETERHNGKPSLRVNNPTTPEGDDTSVTQKITVQPNTRYQMSAYIKTKDVEAVKRGGKNGACVAVVGGYKKTPDVSQTKAWTRVTADFVTGKETEISFGPRLGFYSGLTTGTAWFAEVTLTELGRNAKK